VFFLERTFGSQALPVDPALFLSDHKIGASTDPAAACLDGTPPFQSSGHAFNAQLINLSHFGPF
jgi:hypothetical protein